MSERLNDEALNAIIVRTLDRLNEICKEIREELPLQLEVLFEGQAELLRRKERPMAYSPHGEPSVVEQLRAA